MEVEEWEIRELLLETSFPFLAASEGCWINADLEEMSFKEMSPVYLKRAFNYLGKFEIGLRFALNQNLKIIIKNKPELRQQKYLKNLDEMVNYCVELFENKKSEMKDAVKR